MRPLLECTDSTKKTSPCSFNNANHGGSINSLSMVKNPNPLENYYNAKQLFL